MNKIFIISSRLLSKNVIFTLLLVVVLIISANIRLQQSSSLDFPFTFDQARDMLDLRVMAKFYDFKVPGPTTSITGLNLGPFYYFFNLPAFWLWVGNPQGLVIWNILWFLASAIVIYIFFIKRNVYLGFLISTIYLMSPQLFPVTRYFWNANSVVYFIVFYFLALWNYVENVNKKSALFLGITAGLVIQFEAAFGSICIAFSFLLVLCSRNKLNIRNYLVGMVPWFFPQLISEIIRKFQMTKLFLGALIGTNTILGEKLPLGNVVSMHWKTISAYFEGQFMLNYGLGFYLLMTAIVAGLISKRYRRITMYFLIFMIFTFAYFTAIYRHELKAWHLEGVRVWYCFIIGIAMASVTKFKKILFVLLALLLIRSFYLTVLDQALYIKDNGKSNDPKNAANLVKNIDWIYERARGGGFDAYNYVPEVYDYSAQYLYWWYGNKQFGYIPQKISYSLSPVPKYVRLEDKFHQRIKSDSEGKIALIYETTNDYQNWLDQFKGYCILDKKIFEWNVGVEWREKCNKTMLK